jgi:NAD(P)H-hydrate epimerase
LLGTYIHGLSADIYASEYGEESLVASDIIDNLGAAFETVRS